MEKPIDTMLDVRSLYASDPNRVGAHYLRRHRIRFLKDDPAQPNAVLMGTAIVEVAHLRELSSVAGPVSELFEVDQEWKTIGRLLYDLHARRFHEEITERYRVLLTMPNISFLRHIRLQPQFRGEGWGREFVRQLKTHFKETSSVMLTFSEGAPKPAGMAHPLLPDNWEMDEPFPQSRLLRGIREAGFTSLGRSHLFAANLREDQPDLLR